MTRLRVGGGEDLEAAVEQEAVHDVGAHAPSRGAGALQHQDVGIAARQLGGAAQAGEAGADDDDVAHAGAPCRAVTGSAAAAPGSTRSQ